MEKRKAINMAKQLGIMQHEYNSDIRNLIPLIQEAQGKVPCYKTDLRYTCKSSNCEWNRICKKLTAFWLR